MLQSIELPSVFLQDASNSASVCNRSLPKQIEYWSRIGKIAEENPDLPYGFIKKILLANAEIENGNVTEYKFG